MKKFLMAIFALAVATTVATAGVGIQWQTAWGGYTHDAPNIVDDPSAFALLDHHSVIWQLVYAGADNINNPIPDPATPADITPGGPNGDYVQGDDVVWAQRTISGTGATAPEDGTSWNNFMYTLGTGNPVYENASWSTAGYVYQRVFEDTPADQTWYYDSPLFQYDETWTSSLAPELMNPEVNPGQAGFQPNVQINVVPEPATMSLLGLGALVMAIRRRRS